MEPYRDLALAVIRQAVEDVRKGNLQARRFLLEDAELFPFWCELAGLDSTWMREKFLRRFRRGAPIGRDAQEARIREELKAHPELSNRKIASLVGCHFEQVRQMRLRSKLSQKLPLKSAGKCVSQD